MKSGFLTENKASFKPLFCMFLLCEHIKACVFPCHIFLKELLFESVICNRFLTTRQGVVGGICVFRRALHRTLRLGPNASRIFSTIPPDTGVRPDALTPPHQPFSLYIWATTTSNGSWCFLWHSVINIHCSVVFNCVRAYTNAQNTFLLK